MIEQASYLIFYTSKLLKHSEKHCMTQTHEIRENGDSTS